MSMAPSNLVISKIGPESDVVLRNLFEHYIHDTAEWFEIDTTRGSYQEEIRIVKERPWRFFRFVSDGPEMALKSTKTLRSLLAQRGNPRLSSVMISVPK
jgi:hypothetical protein